jgi:Signal transduction histidine kinase
MLEDDPRPDQLQNLNLLKFSSENLLSIINDILDFSKAEAGKIELEIIPFNLTEIVGHYAKLLEVRANERGIALKLNVDPDLPSFLNGDPVRIGQILNNLIGNAIKFTEAGFVEVTVKKIETNRTNHTLYFAIRDTGIGIASDKIDSVFESFTQGSSSITRKFGGTGLGLTITRKLVSLMGGQMNVESKLGEGSTFSFTIILPEAVGITLEEKPLQKTAAKNLRVLLVEDNRVNQVVASNYLKKWSHEVVVANNGAEAVELIQSKEFDLVLMDLQMPEMDGFEATRRIRQMPESYFKSIPIIALTASVSAEMRSGVLEVGMNEYLTKPFRPTDLMNMVEKFSSRTHKPLKIEIKETKFPGIDVYSEGDDVFKKELIALFINGLEEFRASVMKAISENKPEAFAMHAHKAKTTVGILNDQSLNLVIAQVKEKIENEPEVPSNLLSHFSNVITTVIEDLQSELE